MGLIKTAAKVAVASSVHGRVQRRQQQRWAAQDQAQKASSPLPQPVPAPTTTAAERITQLKALGELRDSGVLNDAEFEAEKRRVLRA
jgi:Short C-terminal domain